MQVFTVELNDERLTDMPYVELSEATAYAAGYQVALENNELITDGEFFIVTYMLVPDSPDGAVELYRTIYP